ncbi:adenylate kinase [Victivallis sp. Marseille-Q1083]|uniref:adenylate kinase n=1 Tax=Victivallis sp. Marseille-Q1083 TaxID=2717288 RepID=UPI001589D030|nr:adenylate kinase [Victivallis sp. Marseille-Q1083]
MISKRNLIFIGAPGAGKGTFSALLTREYPLAHISTGDILRGEIKRDTELGRQAAGLMKEGKLVPDQVVAGMVRNRLTEKDCEYGFILDGFPRTIGQAELLEEALKSLARKLDAVVYFKVDDDIILQRLTARISCKNCGEIYNKLFLPPKQDGVCDKCGGELFQRPDDSLETATERLKVFYANTQPLIDYYAAKGLLLTITELEMNAALAQLKAGLA